MTTGLFAMESRLSQQQTHCSVRESPLFDGIFVVNLHFHHRRHPLSSGFQIKCNTVPAVLLCTSSVFDKKQRGQFKV